MTWNPANIGGVIAEDPRVELAARIALVTEHTGDSYVAIPIGLARALAVLHECDSMHTVTHDEQGRLPHQVKVRCRKLMGHRYQHSNGFTAWDKEGW